MISNIPYNFTLYNEIKVDIDDFINFCKKQDEDIFSVWDNIDYILAVYFDNEKHNHIPLDGITQIGDYMWDHEEIREQIDNALNNE